MDKIRRTHLEEKTGYRKWISKKYYDRPDGQDLLGKLSYTTKMASLGGLACGYAHAMHTNPRVLDPRMKLVRVARFLVPSIGMAVAFTCVTYYATNYRKKDDEFNYALGGAAAGFIVGPASGNVSLGVIGAFVLATLGFAKKLSQLHNRRLTTPIKQAEFSPYITKTWDTTLLRDAPRGNWVKGEPIN